MTTTTNTITTKDIDYRTSGEGQTFASWECPFCADTVEAVYSSAAFNLGMGGESKGLGDWSLTCGTTRKSVAHGDVFSFREIRRTVVEVANAHTC